MRVDIKLHKLYSVYSRSQLSQQLLRNFSLGQSAAPANRLALPSRSCAWCNWPTIIWHPALEMVRAPRWRGFVWPVKVKHTPAQRANGHLKGQVQKLQEVTRTDAKSGVIVPRDCRFAMANVKLGCCCRGSPVKPIREWLKLATPRIAINQAVISLARNVKRKQRLKRSLIGEDNRWAKTAFSNRSTQAANWLEIKTNEQLPHQWTTIKLYFLIALNALRLNPNSCVFNQSE